MWDDREKIIQGSWSSPITNKLLMEAGVSSFNSRWGGQEPAGALMDFIPVLELVPHPGTGTPLPFYAYRAPWSFFGNIADIDQQHNVWRASASYVTGAHNLKVGYQAAYQIEKQHHYSVNSGIQNYLFFDGFPISLTQRISPHMHSNRTRFDAFYVQDQWTKNRVTLQGALRYEHAWSWFPEGENGITAPSRYNAAPILFPDTVGVKGFHDITPRMGIAYDVFGNGKTSLKGSFSKYLQPANNESVFIIGNNAVTFAQTTDRSWFDADGDYVADCDLEQLGRQRRMRPVGQRQLRQGLERHRRQPGGARGLGLTSVRLAGGRVDPAGVDAARVGRPSATTAARGATSTTPTTGRSGPRTSIRPRSPRHATPTWRAAAATR